ncbi:MerR family transcriptional regulator [Atopomonas sediminilitoris]|uniref:MerR family transcriptional regulator n=1 Tax=Atopomonas sediminilitoris TaxID=2919919 RepID=UPI001F4D3DA8|nr:MerR family transcriptional regulator [Atopomonas sediminilitoris]MCJ8169557.1 MerR family transcriptional regulator [Atopomonas sediminilitoris]
MNANSPASGAALRIGELAAATGVSTSALRFYEKHGLLGKAARGGNGYRQYAPDAVERVGLIRLAQRLGFSLEQVRGILGRAGEPLDHQQILTGLQARLAEIEQMQSTLAAQHTGLTCMLGKLHEHWDLGRCLPLAKLLDGHAAGDSA